MTDSLGDRMKSFEDHESGRRLIPRLPVMARLDGRAFSSFTRGLARPFDKRLSDLMVATTEFLVKDTNAVCGYTQSDEITLCWYATEDAGQIYFDGRIQKMVSSLTASCSVYFNRLLPTYIPEKAGKMPTFDCRVWALPTLEEAVNCFMWREWDCTKNSVTMAAQTIYSHKELDGKNGSEKQEMMFHKGVNFNDFPAFFKRGTYVQRRTVKRRMAELTPEEQAELPPLHQARTNPDLEIERRVYTVVPMPPLAKVTNRVDVIFNGHEPETAAD